MRPSIFTLIFSLFALPVLAAEPKVSGSGDIGLWFVSNNVASATGFVANDGVGDSYVQSRFTLLRLGLALQGHDLFESAVGQQANAHFKGRMLINMEDKGYTLGSPNKARQQIDEMNLELQRVGGTRTDLWFGRQTLYAAGGIGFDGIRGVYHPTESVDVALFGGLGTDPRNLTGYIGPAYRANPFTLNFQTFGAYSSYRQDRLKLDGAANVDLFKGKLDRATVFSQVTALLNPIWTLSLLGQGDIAGVKMLRNLEFSAIARPTARVTNTLTFARYAASRYKESDVSAIPVPGGISAGPVGNNEVNTSSYNLAKNHTMFRVFNRNYVFTAFQFARRMFDHRNQYKYTAGFRNPTLFGSEVEFQTKVDVITNYEGFNTGIDTLIGREFMEGRVRLEGGATVWANERDLVISGASVSSEDQLEKEYTARFNVFYTTTNRVTWLLNYALNLEKDATNADQSVTSHEVLLATQFRF